MVRLQNRLTARSVQAKTKAGYFADGGGLYLQVSPTGSKSWVFRFTLNGRAREMGLGAVAPENSLADAREARPHRGVDRGEQPRLGQLQPGLLAHLARDRLEQSLAQPLRAALTGTSTSPGIFDVLEVLGREESLARLRDQAV